MTNTPNRTGLYHDRGLLQPLKRDEPHYNQDLHHSGSLPVMPSRTVRRRRRREAIRAVADDPTWVATQATLPSLVVALKTKYPTAVIVTNPLGHPPSSLCTVEFRKTVFTGGSSIMTISKGMTWRQINRAVVKKRDSVPCDRICDICCEERSANDVNVSCNHCANDFCVECYIGLFRSGNGIIKCPYCRNEFGQLFPPHMIEPAVRLIRLRATRRI